MKANKLNAAKPSATFDLVLAAACGVFLGILAGLFV